MTTLPFTIKTYFEKFLDKTISLADFEQWIYKNSDELEENLSAEDNLKLISLNYQSKEAKYEIQKIISRYVNLSEYETLKFKGMLIEAKEKNENFAELLLEFYYLYERGYEFLKDLATFGLDIENPPSEFSFKDFESLSLENKNQLLNSFSPQVDEEINRVLNWINSGKIILDPIEGPDYKLTYKDNRIASEKESRFWTTVEPKKIRPWWKIW